MNKSWSKTRKSEAKRLAKCFMKQETFMYSNSLSAVGDGVLVLEVEQEYEGKSYKAAGGAKCNCTDDWSEDMGVKIATGRALLRIAYQILRDHDKKTDKAIDHFLKFGFGDNSIHAKAVEAIRLGIEKGYFDRSLGVTLTVPTPSDEILDETMGQGQMITKPEPTLSDLKDIDDRVQEMVDVPGTRTYRGNDEYYKSIVPEKPIDAIGKMRDMGMMEDEADEPE